MTKAIYFLPLLLYISSAEDPLHYLSDEFIKSINAQQTAWTAARTLEPERIEAYMRSLGTVLDYNLEPYLPKVSYKENRDRPVLPKNYDVRVQWSNCTSLKYIRDQADCGSCWAEAGASVMSDRICIHSFGNIQETFSIQDILTCAKEDSAGCDGGSLWAPWLFYESEGVVSGGEYGTTTGCRSYSLSPCNRDGSNGLRKCEEHQTTPECVTQCDKGSKKIYSEDKHFSAKKGIYYVQEEEDIMEEIYKNGPVEVGFSVYEDFGLYHSGIYMHIKGKFRGGHAVKLVGWGEEYGIPYWIVANSWGLDWGENGFFKIVRGLNHLGIETVATAGIPLIKS